MLFEMAVAFPGIPFDQVNKQDYYVRGSSVKAGLTLRKPRYY